MTWFEIEYQQSPNGNWHPLSHVVGGVSKGFSTLEDAQTMVYKTLPVMALQDDFFANLQYRIVCVSRKVVE